MHEYDKLFIGGEWIDPAGSDVIEVISPHDETLVGKVPEGTEADIPSQEFGVVVGEEVEFRFLGSTVRRDDPAGAVVEEWEGQVDELAPVRTTLEAKGTTSRMLAPWRQARWKGVPASNPTPDLSDSSSVRSPR